MRARVKVCLLCMCCWAGLARAEPHQVIFDTDFALPPQDDALALLLALQSPEIEILGVTTVAGNRSREQATVDALKVLEVSGCESIPVYAGADMPLMHNPSSFSERKYGEWWSDEEPEIPPGGLPRLRAGSRLAVDFIVDTVTSNPGTITIVAVGPLTNIAMAIRSDNRFSKSVKKLFIMGGAIASLPMGGGNITPNAEFNFWVDPEAAQIVLESGIPIELSPLNVSRQTNFTKDAYREILLAKTPVTDFLEVTMEKVFRHDSQHRHLMYDQVTVGALIDPTLVEREELYVSVDTNSGPSYGVSAGAKESWEGGERGGRIMVQVELDWPRFIDLFVDRLSLETPCRP